MDRAAENRMHVSIGQRWHAFVNRIVKSGRYGSAGDVVGEGLRLVEQREARLERLRETLNASIAEGGSFSDADIEDAIEAKARELPQDIR
jgi:antitoxin ParD1/3/4